MRLYPLDCEDASERLHSRQRNHRLQGVPFIDDILRYDSLSIVGLEKNTGKTECLKYVLDRLPLQHKRIAVTSIGIDGETVDQVTRTQKPEIVLRAPMVHIASFLQMTPETLSRVRGASVAATRTNPPRELTDPWWTRTNK